MPVFHLDYKLVNFDNWLSMYKESDLRKQLEAKYGLTTRRIAQDGDDPNHVILIFDADSSESVQDFLRDPQLQERFADRSIFAESPKLRGVYEASNLEEFSDGENPAFFIDHQLADFYKWYESFSANQLQPNEKKSELGIKHIRLLHDLEDDGHAIVVSVAPNRSALEELMSQPRAQELFANRDIFKQAPEITGQFSRVAF